MNSCTIKLEIDSPYFERPIAVTKTVYVGPPQAEFSSNLTHWTGVSPLAVQFYDTSLGGPVDTWNWDFGDGTTSTLKDPVHTFTVGPNEIRTFTVTLTVTGWEKSSTCHSRHHGLSPRVREDRLQRIRGPGPAVRSSSRTSPPASRPTGSGTSATVRTSTAQNPTHTFTKEGMYNVNLFAERAQVDSPTHSLDMKMFPVYIRVGAPVTADFSATPLNGTAPLAVQFTDLSTSADPIISWDWDFESDGTIDSTVQNPSHTYAKAGTYTVTLKAYNAQPVRHR